MFVRRLKNKITRQVSRSPRPYAMGPNVPAENLSSSVNSTGDTGASIRHTKGY